MNDKKYEYKIRIDASNHRIKKDFLIEFTYDNEETYTDSIKLIELLLNLSSDGTVDIHKKFYGGDDASSYNAEIVCVLYVEIW